MRFMNRSAARTTPTVTAITNANVNLPTGTMYGDERNVVVKANGQLLQAVAFVALDVLIPGRLGHHLMEPAFHPASLVSAAVQLAVAAIIFLPVIMSAVAMYVVLSKVRAQRRLRRGPKVIEKR